MYPTAPNSTTVPEQPAQPSQEEVQAAITREQTAQMEYLHNRVLQMSITNARLEAQLQQAHTEIAALRERAGAGATE